MHLPQLPLASNSPVHVEGEVSIDPSAAIAPGVILRAAPDSRIIIAAGVCIGMGSILNANQGNLEIEAGATLGAGVLVIGNGKIGTNACIGSLTTICESSIEPYQVIPAASLIGKAGRIVTKENSLNVTSSNLNSTPDSSSHPTSTTLEQTPTASSSGSTKSQEDFVEQNHLAEPKSTFSTNQQQPTEPTSSKPDDPEDTVYGQNGLNDLLKTLFPHKKQSFNPPPKEG
ncbi:MAG: hypothetical protein WA919_14195 [Coleofasciculaceae cyanobacterium]